MEKTRVAFKFAGFKSWFTCDASRLEVTIAKARQANGLTSYHEVEIFNPNEEVKGAKTKSKQKENGNTSTTTTDNTTDSYFDRDIDLYSALSESPEEDPAV